MNAIKRFNNIFCHTKMTILDKLRNLYLEVTWTWESDTGQRLQSFSILQNFITNSKCSKIPFFESWKRREWNLECHRPIEELAPNYPESNFMFQFQHFKLGFKGGDHTNSTVGFIIIIIIIIFRCASISWIHVGEWLSNVFEILSNLGHIFR